MKIERMRELEKYLRTQFERCLNTKVSHKSQYIPATECRDEIDHVAAIQFNGSLELLEAQNDALADEIDTALARIKSGQYGECLKCRDEIDPKRLEASPTAGLCIKCQSYFERRYC